MPKDFGGLDDLEVLKLINKKKRRYCRISLNELEEEGLSEEQFRRIRKIILDNMSSFCRSVFVVIGIEIEGAEEEE